MSDIFGGGDQTSTVQTQQTLDPFIREALQGSVLAARQVASLPYQPYSGPRIAGFRPAEQQAFDILGQAAANRVGSQQLAGATQAAQRAAGYGPEQFQQNVAGFMSPYQQNVIDTTMARLSQARAEREAATQANLASARAFGNTRRGVYEAQLAGQEDLNTAQTLANLYQQGYGQAASLASGLPGQQLAAASQLAALAPQALAQEQAYAGLLSGVGQQQRQMAQSNLDLAYRDFLEQRGYPVEQLRILQSGLTGLPAVMSETRTATQPGDGFLGGAANTIGILGGLNRLFPGLF
jgi:hypothetical protein